MASSADRTGPLATTAVVVGAGAAVAEGVAGAAPEAAGTVEESGAEASLSDEAADVSGDAGGRGEAAGVGSPPHAQNMDTKSVPKRRAIMLASCLKTGGRGATLGSSRIVGVVPEERGVEARRDGAAAVAHRRRDEADEGSLVLLLFFLFLLSVLGSFFFLEEIAQSNLIITHTLKQIYDVR